MPLTLLLEAVTTVQILVCTTRAAKWGVGRGAPGTQLIKALRAGSLHYTGAAAANAALAVQHAGRWRNKSPHSFSAPHLGHTAAFHSYGSVCALHQPHLGKACKAPQSAAGQSMAASHVGLQGNS